MAQQADGTVYIDTLLDTTGFKAGGKDVEAAVRRMSKTVSGIGATAKIALQKQTDAFVKANQAYAQQEQKVDALKNKLKEMSEQKVATDEFKEIGKQIDNDTAKLNRLEKAQEEFLAVGGKESSSAYRRREMEIEELRNSIKYAKGEQEDLLNTGGAYKAVDTSGVEQKLFNEEQRLQNMNNSLATSYASLKSRVDSYSGSAINLASVKERLGKSFSSLLSTVKKTAKTIGGTLLSALKRAGAAMLNLHKNTKKSDRSIGSSLKTMLKYGLGIRSVFVLVNKLRRALVDGFKNLAQYDGRTNASISSLMSALTQLKNSFATAFAPILNVVAPILKTFINMIARAVTYVGMLIAALTGQDSFVRATEVQEDYAASLVDTADNYKKAEKAQNRYLSGLDEIRRWENPNDNNSDSGSVGGYTAPTPGEMFETVPIENSLKNLAEKIKEMWKNADFTDLGRVIGGKIRDALEKIPWDTIKPTAEKVGKSIATFLNGGIEVPGFAASIGKSVGELINTGLSLASGFIENFRFDSLGWFIADGMNSAIDTISWSGIGTTIRNGLNGVFKAAETWSGKFNFKQLGKAVKTLINSTLTGINWKRAITAAQNIGNGIADALNEVINPETFGKIGDAVANAVRVVIAGVKSFVTKADFYNWGVSLGTALNEFFNTINWREVGLTLDGLIGGLVDFMKGLVDSGQFESFAAKIGTALSSVNWLGHLFSAGRVILEALKDILVGGASTPAGKFVEALGLGFVATKLAGSIYKFVSGIGALLVGDRNTQVLKKALEDILGPALKEAAEKSPENIKPLTEALEEVEKKSTTALTSLKILLNSLGSAALISGALIGVVELSKGIGELIEKLQGGNGKFTEMGGAVHNFADEIGKSSLLTAQQKDELWNLIEANESAVLSGEMGAEELASSIVSALGDMGISAEQAKIILENAGFQMTNTAGSAEILKEQVDGLGEGFSKTGEMIDLATVDKSAAFDGIYQSLLTLRDTNGEVNSNFFYLNDILEDAKGKGLDAQSAMDALCIAMEDLGIPTDDFIKLMKDKFPEAMQAAEQSSSTGMANLEGNVTTKTKAADTAVKTATDNIKKNTDASMTAVDKKTDEAFSNVESTSDTTWANSESSVKNSLLSMKSESATTMSQIFKNVESYSKSIYNTIVNNFTFAMSKVTIEFANFEQDVSFAVGTIADDILNTFNFGSSMYEKGRNLITSFVNGLKSVYIPTPHLTFTTSTSTFGNTVRTTSSSLVSWYKKGGLFSSPSVIGVGEAGEEAVLPIESRPVMAKLANNIVSGLSAATLKKTPIMATGSVVPPRATSKSNTTDFQHTVASLSNLLDKLELPANRYGTQNMTIRIPVILDGRQVFEAIIDEARMKQMVSGRNPFEMA